MGKNVNTKPSIDNNSISIKWFRPLNFSLSPTRDNQRGYQFDAKKLKIGIGKDGYTPKVGKVGKTYIIERNNRLKRYIKVDKKLKEIATIKEEKIKNLKKRISQKYSQKDSFSR